MFIFTTLVYLVYCPVNGDNWDSHHLYFTATVSDAPPFPLHFLSHDSIIQCFFYFLTKKSLSPINRVLLFAYSRPNFTYISSFGLLWFRYNLRHTSPFCSHGKHLSLRSSYCLISPHYIPPLFFNFMQTENYSTSHVPTISLLLK